MKTLSDRMKFLSSNLPRGWQAKLARYCGVKPQSVTGWLTGGTKVIEGEHLLLAAKFFNVEPLWLSTGAGVRDVVEADSLDRELLLAFSRLRGSQKRALLAMAESMADTRTK